MGIIVAQNYCNWKPINQLLRHGIGMGCWAVAGHRQKPGEAGWNPVPLAMTLLTAAHIPKLDGKMYEMKWNNLHISKNGG